MSRKANSDIVCKGTNVNIKASDKFVLPIIIEENNSFLDYKFQTDAMDINFSIEMEEENNIYYLKPQSRINSINITNFIIKNKCKLLFEWDNTYSWINDKQISYEIQIKAPQKEENRNESCVALGTLSSIQQTINQQVVELEESKKEMDKYKSELEAEREKLEKMQNEFKIKSMKYEDMIPQYSLLNQRWTTDKISYKNKLFTFVFGISYKQIITFLPKEDLNSFKCVSKYCLHIIEQSSRYSKKSLSLENNKLNIFPMDTRINGIVGSSDESNKSYRFIDNFTPVHPTINNQEGWYQNIKSDLFYFHFTKEGKRVLYVGPISLKELKSLTEMAQNNRVLIACPNTEQGKDGYYINKIGIVTRWKIEGNVILNDNIN